MVHRYPQGITDFYNARLGQTVTFTVEAVSGAGDGIHLLKS